MHASIAFCKNYRPKALLPLEKQQRYWEGVVGIGEKAGMEWTRGWEDLLEMDIFDASTADKIVEQIEASVNPTTPVNLTIWVHRLTVMTWSGKLIQLWSRSFLTALRLLQLKVV